MAMTAKPRRRNHGCDDREPRSGPVRSNATGSSHKPYGTNGSVLIAMEKIDGVSLKKHVVGDIKAIEPKRQLRVWGEEKPVRRRCAATV